jgi:hypothetical protein
MAWSPEAKRAVAAAAGVAALALLFTRLRGPAEQVVKPGLVDDPERVGKPTSGTATSEKQRDDDFEYDFIIIGGGM